MTRVQANAGRLLERAAAGEASAWGELLTAQEGRLRRVVAFRLDPRLNGRVDAGDVVQEAYLEAARHRPTYFGGRRSRSAWYRSISSCSGGQKQRYARSRDSSSTTCAR